MSAEFAYYPSVQAEAPMPVPQSAPMLELGARVGSASLV